MAAYENYLTRTLAFSQRSVAAILANGLDSFDKLVKKNDAEILCVIKNIRNPGGLKHGRPLAENVANRGTDIDADEAMLLRQVAYYCFHSNRISRLVVAEESLCGRLDNSYSYASTC